MDGHHHMPPHGHESSYQNGYNAPDEYANILPNGGDNDNFVDWQFDATSHMPNANVQSDPYSAWHSNNALDNYNSHAFTSRTSSTNPASSYTGYTGAHQFAQSSYDPSLVSNSANGPSAYELGPSPYGQHQSMQHATIAPQALEHERPHTIRPSQSMESQSYARAPAAAADVSSGYARAIPQAPPANQVALFDAIPPGNRNGNFWTVKADDIDKATNSTQVSPFVHVGQQEFEYPINRATLAPIVRRKSRNELRKIAGSDIRLQAKLGKKHATKARTPVGGVRASNQPSQSAKQDQSASDTETSDYSSDEDSDEEEEVSPLPSQRPEDSKAGVRYDTIKALWESYRGGVTADRIRNGMTEFNDVVQTIKNRLKADSSALSDAMDRKKTGELPLLRSRVNDQLDLLKVALKTALEYGHRDIVGQLGQHAQIMASFAQFLIDRIRLSDPNGDLTHLVLEMLLRCDTLTEKAFAGTKLQKCILNLSKNGNTKTQDLCRRVKMSVAETTKKQSGEQPSSVKSPPSGRPTPEPVAGVKRAAPGNGSSDQASKKVLVNPGTASGAPVGGTKTATVKRTLPIGSAPKSVPAAKPVVGAAVKPKPIAAKPTTSAATGAGVKKAVTKSATPSVVAAAIKSIEKKATPAAPAKPAFSFAETMANLNKSKEKEPASSNVDEKQPEETEDQRKKRLHKEARRKLRVTFKPDNQLVQVRIFHHDADEELGHDASMIRDVADVGGEGRMFKQHKDMMDIDEDDDGPGEENLGEYSPLTPTNFSDVDSEERKRNYSPFGGGELQADSPERTKREQYEASTLMVFYTDSSDIPPCPREPADPYNGEEVSTKAFGSPDGQEPLASRISKLAGQNPPAQHQQGQQQPATPDISKLLALIGPSQNPAQSQPTQPIPVAAPVQSQNQDQMSAIQRILASIPQPAQPQQQPVHQTQNTAPPDLAGIFASLNPQAQDTSAFNPVQQQQSQQQPPVLDPNPAHFAAFLSQLGQGQNNGPPFNPFAFPGAGFNMPNMGQFPGQQQAQQQAAPYENEERRRYREGGDNSADQKFRGKPGKKPGGFMDKRFTVPCKYWKLGKCQKGDNCTYRHD